MEACLIIGLGCENVKFDFNNKICVGVDKGCMYAKEHNIHLNYAIGDFDSFREVVEADHVIRLNCEKDMSDLAFAISMFKGCEKVYVLGGVSGRRIEHFISNMLLHYKYDNLVFIDDNSMIYRANTYEEFIKDDFEFISFYAIENVKGLTLTGFKYELNNYDLAISNPLCLSNELVYNKGLLSFESGKLMVIKSRRD